MKMKKSLSMILALAMVFVLCACGGNNSTPSTGSQSPTGGTSAGGPSAGGSSANGAGDPEYTEITLKFGTSSAEATLTAQTFMHWGELLSEATGGKVNVDVYCSSILGSNTEMTQGVQMGTIDMVVLQPGGVADMGASKMNLLGLPYLFGSYDQYYNTLFGEVGKTLLQDVTDNVNGIVGFSFLPDGGRCYFYNGKPITTIDDIKGVKLRVQPYAVDNAAAVAPPPPLSLLSFTPLWRPALSTALSSPCPALTETRCMRLPIT